MHEGKPTVPASDTPSDFRRRLLAAYDEYSADISIVVFLFCSFFLIAAIDRNSSKALGWGIVFWVLLGIHAAIRVLLYFRRK